MESEEGLDVENFRLLSIMVTEVIKISWRITIKGALLRTLRPIFQFILWPSSVTTEDEMLGSEVVRVFLKGSQEGRYGRMWRVCSP